MHQKLKATPGVYLVGFMGCGKSTVGRMLAEKLGWDFVDLDQQIERRAGKAISQVFAEEGEPAFRDLEHETLCEQVRKVRGGHARVVALGGGAFVPDRNRIRLEDGGLTIWLDAPAETLWDRVRQENHRPLAQDRAAFEQLLYARREAYAKADLHVNAAAAAETIVVEILENHLV